MLERQTLLRNPPPVRFGSASIQVLTGENAACRDLGMP